MTWSSAPLGHGGGDAQRVAKQGRGLGRAKDERVKEDASRSSPHRCRGTGVAWHGWDARLCAG